MIRTQQSWMKRFACSIYQRCNFSTFLCRVPGIYILVYIVNVFSGFLLQSLYQNALAFSVYIFVILLMSCANFLFHVLSMLVTRRSVPGIVLRGKVPRGFQEV